MPKLNPQQKRIVDAFHNSESGITVQFINMPRPEGLGISQHGARILELRRMGFVIDNDKECHFVLVREPEWYKDQHRLTWDEMREKQRIADNIRALQSFL